MGIIITTTARQRKMLKEAYEKALNIRCDICWRALKRGGTIIPGYDMDKEIEEILKRSVSDGS